MSLLRFESPLSWPVGLAVTPRNNQRADHGFPPQKSLSESIGFLDEELEEMSAGKAVLYLDIEQPLVERLRKKVGSRTGVCLHFKYQGKSYALACDRWQSLEHNIYALHLALRQWRSIDRWGVGSLSVLLAGFEANRMPEAATHETAAEPWMASLGLGPTATLDDAVAVYHRRAKQVAHDTESLARLNALMDEARNYFGQRKSS